MTSYFGYEVVDSETQMTMVICAVSNENRTVGLRPKTAKPCSEPTQTVGWVEFDNRFAIVGPAAK
jgi:hypothetical protein